ncbi:murein hydrolase activator EnvC family protein [Candidatus Nitrospira bockiana]
MRALPGLIACMLGAAWLMAGPGLAKDRGSDPIAEKIERERRALERLQQEIEQKKKHAQEAEKKKESVLQAIEDLDDDLTRKRKERLAISRKLREKDQEIERINAQLGAVRGRIDDRRQSILARLRAQYMEGRFGHLATLLSAENYETLERRLRYLSAVSQREYDLVESYRQDVSRLEQMERQRAAVRDEMIAIKAHTERKLTEIQGLKRKKNVILAKITQEKESSERALAELERSAARVDGLLKELEQRRKAAASFVPPKNLGGHPLKGALHWPAEGEVVSFFGRQKHRSFNTYVQRKGIEIRTEEGAAIRAVMPGTVVYADWLKGYGQVIILDHANGFFSLYAHASNLLVKVGEQVPTGHVIGETGDTGLTGDSTLYFELREGAEPIDPLMWLAKRR